MTAISETPVDDLSTRVHDAARAARGAATVLAQATRQTKDTALLAMADSLTARADEILASNERDSAAGRAAGTSDAILDCPALYAKWISAIAYRTQTVPGK